MDTLSEILRTLKLSGSLYFRTELSAPWGLEVPVDSQAVRFHVVVQGTCWLRLVGVPKAIPLTTGDLALVPYGKAHQLSDDHSTPCRPLFDVLEEQQFAGHGTLRYGGGGVLTQLVCGYVGFVPEASHPLLESLPEPLILPGEQTQQQHGLSTVIELITQEAGSDHLGASALVDRLSEVLFIQMLRLYVARAPDRASCLAALGDAYIGQVLHALHQQPASQWTVKTLARTVGLSRSSFAARFTPRMGMPPLRYLTRWRIELAKRALETSQESISQIAEQVGYRSEAAFIMVFKRYVGCTPSVYRRRVT
jgi:AraC family transcriptional regulator, activator of mtrCDE